MKRLVLLLFISMDLVVAEGQSPLSNTGKLETIAARIPLPASFERTKEDSSSFGTYLRNLELKPIGSSVRYFDGRTKANDHIYVAVIKMDIGTKDLQQCADAVMRLRGEYLFKKKAYDKIHFDFLSDLKPRYFKDYAKGNYSYANFRAYMEFVFSRANTASLHHELPSVGITTMQIGDVLIQKRQPFGHAVIVVDMAVHPKTGKKVYLLAQSYMPAQETQILANPSDPQLSPWYELNDQSIVTPEWTFGPQDLKRFKDE
jgi:hypothetical protein